MTDPITTPAQMREAVEQAVLAEKMRMMSWCAKRQAVSRKAWERAARKALTGDISDLRNRIAMIDAEPLDIVLSGADGDALPVADQQAIRDRALDDAAQAASNRAAYWWDEATAADYAGLRKLSLSYEAKALACTELAAAIRVMKGKPE